MAVVQLVFFLFRFFLSGFSSLIAQIHYNELDAAFVSLSLNYYPFSTDLEHLISDRERERDKSIDDDNSDGNSNKCSKKWKCEFRSVFFLFHLFSRCDSTETC